jgi:threonine aldolase
VFKRQDPDNARHLPAQVAAIDGITIDPGTVETNIVIFEVDPLRHSAPELARRLAQLDVRLAPISPTRLRAVTHLDVDSAAIDRALAALRATVG